jgi:prepilin-type N-terminal cleavage/methylation domain-containing protein
MKRNTQTINKTNFALRGFTLLELIVVIAIIGILSVVVLPNFTGALAKARDARKVAELKGVATNLTVWAQDNNGRYPATGNTNLSTALLASTGKPLPSGFTTTWATGFNVYNYVGVSCTGATSADTCAAYQLWTELENSGTTALNSDADVANNAALIAKYPGMVAGTGDGTVVSGAVETCASNITTGAAGSGAVDCVFDLIP